jgi:hypothetical protein
MVACTQARRAQTSSQHARNESGHVGGVAGDHCHVERRGSLLRSQRLHCDRLLPETWRDVTRHTGKEMATRVRRIGGIGLALSTRGGYCETYLFVTMLTFTDLRNGSAHACSRGRRVACHTGTRMAPNPWLCRIPHKCTAHTPRTASIRVGFEKTAAA